jgi:hypothetical protein
MRIQENTIQLEVSDGRFFRLKECETFETVRGNTPRDVDVIWQNEENYHLYLVTRLDVFLTMKTTFLANTTWV